VHKELIHIFFLLQRQRASIRIGKISSFKLILRWNLPLDVADAKQKALIGTLEFEMDLAATSQQIVASTCVEQKLLAEKEPLRVE